MGIVLKNDFLSERAAKSKKEVKIDLKVPSSAVTASLATFRGSMRFKAIFYYSFQGKLRLITASENVKASVCTAQKSTEFHFSLR